MVEKKEFWEKVLGECEGNMDKWSYMCEGSDTFKTFYNGLFDDGLSNRMDLEKLHKMSVDYLEYVGMEAHIRDIDRLNSFEGLFKDSHIGVSERKRMRLRFMCWCIRNCDKYE